MLDALLFFLPFLSAISITVTIIAWAKGWRRNNQEMMTNESFSLRFNKRVVRKNGLLLMVDTGVMIYFVIITPDVVGFFWVLLIVVVSSVHNIATAIAGLYEKWVVEDGDFTHHRFLRPQTRFRLDEVVHVHVKSRSIVLNSCYDELITIRHQDMDVEGISLLSQRLQEMGVASYEDLLASPKEGKNFVVFALMAVQAGILGTVIMLTAIFPVTDTPFLYNAMTPIEVLEGYRDWFYTRVDNVAIGLSFIYGFNLILLFFLRSKQFTNTLIILSALSFFVVIMLFFAEASDSAWALERVNEDLVAVAAGEIEPRVLVFGLDWDYGGDFRLTPGEFTALQWWGVRDLDVEGQHLLFARSMDSPAEIRDMMRGSQFQLHRIDPDIRFFLVRHTPRLGMVLDWVPIDDSETINRFVQY